ncbi:MAG TPA: translation elongation factor Ts [Candidatus Saccharimonadales bacterium]|nr:translation elongation factor Ts [Candidatus Saccharimonadales bacterium]
MSFTIEDVKTLRERTGAGMMDAKKALVETDGNMEQAMEVLRKKGAAQAAKRADREARNGVVASYVHGEKIGVLVEVNCETDFVARTEDFKNFAKDIAMHIAATDPEYLNPESVPEDVVSKEKEMFYGELVNSPAGEKPDDIKLKIVNGKIDKYYETVCLSRQPFVKDPDKTIEALTTEVSAKVGENVVIRQFSRLELGASS